jgi:hypothetical protein
LVPGRPTYLKESNGDDYRDAAIKALVKHKGGAGNAFMNQRQLKPKRAEALMAIL